MTRYLSSELEEIVTRAYTVFATSAPTSIRVCTDCCMNPDVARAMLASPVDQISLLQIQEWYGAAKEPDLPLAFGFWFLPRVLDFLGQGLEVSDVGCEIIFQHFPDDSPVALWPKEQRALFEAFASAYMDARLGQPSPELDANLCMIAKSGIDMQIVLDRLSDAHPLQLAKAALADKGFGMWQLGRDAFWTDGPAREAVRNWPQDAGISDKLMQWALTQDDETAEIIWQAVDLIPNG